MACVQDSSNRATCTRPSHSIAYLPPYTPTNIPPSLPHEGLTVCKQGYVHQTITLRQLYSERVVVLEGGEVLANTWFPGG